MKLSEYFNKPLTFKFEQDTSVLSENVANNAESRKCQRNSDEERERTESFYGRRRFCPRI